MESYVELKASLVLAMDRLGMTFKNIENTIDDIVLQFPILTINQFRTAVRNGSLGHYGQTFKLNTQIVCIWVDKHLEELKGTKTHQIKEKIKSDFIIPNKIDISNPKNVETFEKILFKALTPIGNKTLFDFYDEDILMIVKCVRNDDIKKDRL